MSEPVTIELITKRLVWTGERYASSGNKILEQKVERVTTEVIVRPVNGDVIRVEGSEYTVTKVVLTTGRHAAVEVYASQTATKRAEKP